MGKPVSICVIGSGYVGLVAAVCFAEMGHQVICVDNDEARVKTLREGGVPIFEQHLPELLAKHRDRGVELHLRSGRGRRSRARPSSSPWALPRAIPAPPTFPTWRPWSRRLPAPSTATRSSWKRARCRSTPTSGFAACCTATAWTRSSFDVVSNPEFLREGTAVMDFLHPDRIVVGADTERSAEVLRRIYEPLTGGSYYAQPDALAGRLQRCSARPGFWSPRRRARRSSSTPPMPSWRLKISFINAVANLAETVDADIEDIAAGMGMDSRIGPKFLQRRPGLWRLLFSQRCGRLSLGGATAGRGLPTA